MSASTQTKGPVPVSDNRSQSKPCAIETTTRREDSRIVREGARNDNLFRYGCAMRRRGASHGEIEEKLLGRNEQFCKPPLDVEEVSKIAASAGRYEPGGSDILADAWKAIGGRVFESNYERFLALARELQRARTQFPVALPLERIAELFECNWSAVRRWRQRAMKRGKLKLTTAAVPNRQAAMFQVSVDPEERTRERTHPTSGTPSSTTSSGLVVHPSSPLRQLPDQVRRLAARGWRLFPCREKAKEPLIRKWPDLASSNIDQIELWYRRWPVCNWGIVTGQRSGIWVLDCDGQDGLESFWLKCKEHGVIDTLAVRTSNEGTHLYFRWPTNGAVRTAAKVLPGVDVRGEGGYVISPGSIHPDGVQYEWLGDRESQPIADAPDWLLGLALRQPVQSAHLGECGTAAIQ